MIMEDTESRKVSFREMLMVNVGGFARGSVGVTKEGLVNEDFEILDGDIKVVQLDINLFSTEFKPFGKLVGSFQIIDIDIDNDYFLVKFVEYQDYSKALTEGP
ncbi:hypothetical protein Gogos_012078 [Gossypium gossypioides]|uniref:DUF4283 domain-containing protein n=1 Tax=Gossypium gossypioides TaxID=34282 RepID=A0A7J9BRD9_GOSGO|nr:hypothetical protein [Gossypium gossypioides]